MSEEQNRALHYPLSDEVRTAQLWTVAAGDEKLSLHLDWYLCSQGHNAGATGKLHFKQVRETSRKPDEMYSLLERLNPGTWKLEFIARPHNVQPGWVCLGNQLDGTKIADPEMLAAYTKAYGIPPTPKRQLPHQKD
ncbi:hypothetical protein WJX77_002203 [Trebouxia sp. C0004]